MKEEIKNPKNAWNMIHKKQWKHIEPVVRKILQTKILVLEELSKID